VNGPEVLDKVFLSIDDESLPDMTRLADGVNELRLFAGHAAWVPGQLQNEVNAGGWQVLAGTAELVFHTDPGSLWSELEGRGGGGANVVAEIRTDAPPAPAQPAAALRGFGILARSALR
jgi:putative AlgH/UPF0301 family transcriptional regulator